MRKRSLAFSQGLVAVVAGLVLAACGSSSSKSSTSSGGTTTTASAAAPSTAASGQAVVKTKADPNLGTILADASGKTLYTLTNNGKAVACTGSCAAVWPPLEAPAGVTTPAGSSGVPALAVADAPDGTKLVTAGGLPLYRFSKDGDAGDAYGEGIQSFGGVWHVVKTGGTTTPSSGAGATASTTGY